ncbi:MAG: glutamate--tRNA ligase [Bacilli bacterium]|nr:glutamate--tRNA ligase [Bacilli bacterium]
MSVRTRYAPSPTGHLHIGGARTALWSYLYAKQLGGQFILRIEDTDLERNVPGAAEEFFNGLRWLGIEWDEGEDVGGPYGPYRCTERLPIYHNYIQQLLNEGKAYRCYCTVEELATDREELDKGAVLGYSGRCRHLTEEERLAFEVQGRSHTIRFRVPAGETIAFHDLVRGIVSFETDGNDFVIVKSNGMPTYNFQVVIDDYLMAITHATRGEEHLSNTPRQIMIYQAFGWEPPQFGHLNLILNEDGKKLSKRDESIIQFISQYRDMGYLPEAILNFLALLGWSPGGEEEILSKEELIQKFSFDRVNKSGSIFDQNKLTWMNSYYIKQADLQRLVQLCIPHLQKAGLIGDNFNREWITRLVGIYQEKITHAGELPEMCRHFFTDEAQWDAEAAEILNEPQVTEVVSAFISATQNSPEWSVEEIKTLLKLVQKETGHKGRALFMTVRAAATGQVHGPDLNESLYLLGRHKVLARLHQIMEVKQARTSN